MTELTWTGWLWIAGSGIYVIGFLFTLFVNLNIGPVSVPLAIVRSLGWFVWWPWPTKWFRGQRARGPD